MNYDVANDSVLVEHATCDDWHPAEKPRIGLTYRPRKRRGFRDEDDDDNDDDDCDVALSSAKQHISEDRVATELGQLRLDHDQNSRRHQFLLNVERPKTSSVIIEDCSSDSDSDYSSDDRSASLPLVELSSKLKEHVSNARFADLLPQKVLESINPPCMELVVWKPRLDVLLQTNTNSEIDTENKESDENEMDVD
ncbi:uncharacterized protein [Oscarella lobularis]|uniref:uncharacterized protein isoform X3 n=1 Tax=Oscarella lobularis TaxID=121494 RepID=UPI003313A36F